MGTLSLLGKVNRQRLPFLPTASSGHFQCGKALTSETVNTYLNLSATQARGHTGEELLSHISIELHVLQFDIVAIMDLSDIHTNLIILFGLHATTESHGLGLHLSVGIEGGDRFHALIGRQNFGERAISVILELLHSHATTETATLRQFASVVEEI